MSRSSRGPCCAQNALKTAKAFTRVSVFKWPIWYPGRIKEHAFSVSKHFFSDCLSQCKKKINRFRAFTCHTTIFVSRSASLDPYCKTHDCVRSQRGTVREKERERERDRRRRHPTHPWEGGAERTGWDPNCCSQQARFWVFFAFQRNCFLAFVAQTHLFTLPVLAILQKPLLQYRKKHILLIALNSV